MDNGFSRVAPVLEDVLSEGSIRIRLSLPNMYTEHTVYRLAPIRRVASEIVPESTTSNPPINTAYVLLEVIFVPVD